MLQFQAFRSLSFAKLSVQELWSDNSCLLLAFLWFDNIRAGAFKKLEKKPYWKVLSSKIMFSRLIDIWVLSGA